MDGMGLQEFCIKWGAVKFTRSITNLLRDGAEDMRASTAYNKLEKENTGIKQRGRTATILCNQLIGFTRDKGLDHTSLSR